MTVKEPVTVITSAGPASSKTLSRAAPTSVTASAAAPIPVAAAATSAAGMPRAVGAVQHTTSSAWPASSPSSTPATSRPDCIPTTRNRRPAGAKSSLRAAVAARAPSGLWAPSRMVNGSRPTISNRPGTLTLANAASTTSSGRGPSKNASAVATASDTLSSWWRPCSATSAPSWRPWGVYRSADHPPTASRSLSNPKSRPRSSMAA